MTPIYNRLRAQTPELDGSLWDAHIDHRDDVEVSVSAFICASFGWLLCDFKDVTA